MSLYTDPGRPLLSAQRLLMQAIAAVPVFFLGSQAARTISQRFPVLSQARRSEKPRFDFEPLRLRMAAVAHALTEMGDMLDQAASTASSEPRAHEESGPIGAQAVVPLKQVAERVCRDCERRSTCWEDEFGDNTRGLFRFIRQLSISGHVSSESDASGYQSCVRFPEVVAV